MDKFALTKSSENIAEKNFIRFLSVILILLMTFNLGWLLLVIKTYFRLTEIRTFSRAFINLESVLILCNFSTLTLFLGYVVLVRSVRGILGRKS